MKWAKKSSCLNILGSQESCQFLPLIAKKRRKPEDWLATRIDKSWSKELQVLKLFYVALVNLFFLFRYQRKLLHLSDSNVCLQISKRKIEADRLMDIGLLT